MENHNYIQHLVNVGLLDPLDVELLIEHPLQLISPPHLK